jgi:predicted transcriptional regulator
MPIIKKREKSNRIPRTFRLKPELVKKLSEIAKETNESITYVLESLLDYAIKAYDKERERTSKRKKP